MCDALHYEMSQWLRPGLTENQVAAHGFEFLYSFPGVEDVEDVIVSSGPNAWPNWRNFSDRIIRPGELVIIDVAALTWNGFKSCVYRTYCVGGKPTDEMKQYYDTALTWLRDSIDAVKPGVSTRDIASKWPSAMETWGYADEDEAAANLWGHGLGLGAVRPAGDLADLVARPSDRDQARHGVRARDAAREGARVRRAAGGDADRDRDRARADHVLPDRRDHGRWVEPDGWRPSHSTIRRRAIPTRRGEGGRGSPPPRPPGCPSSRDGSSPRRRRGMPSRRGVEALETGRGAERRISRRWRAGVLRWTSCPAAERPSDRTPG